MTEAHSWPDDGRRLTVDFAAWLNQVPVPPERFFRTGLVVLDANVLLDLYRITPDARTQVLDAFGRIGDRLWVPYQAAIEFSRNRKRVVEDRMSTFKQARHLLRAATGDAVEVLESAVAQLQDLRERNATTRQWDLREAALDRESLHARLAGVMDSALAELAALDAEHDLRPKDMQHLDPLLSQIDELLAQRIGPGYPAPELRALVEDAHSFRFPNKIPPGFLDAGKENPLRAAGDFLLWRQTLDKAAQIADQERLVMLITRDFKGDWWELDAKKRPRGPRPELVQELRDLARADLLLVSLRDFTEGAKIHLSSAVSNQTLEELQGIGDDVETLLPEIFHDPSIEPNLLDLGPREFERLVHYLLIQMGYSVEQQDEIGDRGFDFLLADRGEIAGRAVVVEVKRYSRVTPAAAVFQLLGALRSANAHSALLITTSSFGAAGREAAQNQPIELIDGAALLRLLAEHGIRATIQMR